MTPSSSNPSSDKQETIRRLLDDADRHDARQAAIEADRMRFRPWLHLTPVLRHAWDFLERQGLVGGWLAGALGTRPIQPPSSSIQDSPSAQDRTRRALNAIKRQKDQPRN